MKITTSVLDLEIEHATKAVEQQHNQLWFAKGGLSVLQQLRKVLDQPDVKLESDKDASEQPISVPDA